LGSIRLVDFADDGAAANERNFAAASNACAGYCRAYAVKVASAHTYHSPLTLLFEALMGPVAVGSAIGAAALTVGSGALGAVSNTLSFASELFKAAGGGGNAPESKADPIALQKALLQQRSDELRARIQQQLSAAGISLSQPVDLVSNGQGGIAVAGAHPQQAAVEAALGSDVLLERDFNNLASDYSDFVASGNAAGLPSSLTVTIPPT
jgi:hypothetical protein